MKKMSYHSNKFTRINGHIYIPQNVSLRSSWVIERNVGKLYASFHIRKLDT